MKKSEKEMRELDAELAILIGWKGCDCVNGIKKKFGPKKYADIRREFLAMGSKDRWPEQEPDLPCDHYPRYTTDRAAAMEVLEKLVDNDDVTIRAIANQFLVSTADDPDKAPNRNMVKANTLPLAICLFAKKIYETKT